MKGRHQGWRRGYAVATALAVMTAAFGCNKCIPRKPGTITGPFPDGNYFDAGMDAGPPSFELASGNFWNIYSGIAYADAGGAVLHAVVGEGVSQAMQQAPLGDLAAIQVAPPFTNAVTEDHLAYVDDVVVSPAPPERFLFLDGFGYQSGVGEGTLMMTDLSDWHASQVVAPQTTALSSTNVTGTGVTPSAFYFGQNGNEILFIDDFSPISGTGTLIWTNGNGKFQQIGTGAETASLVLSADRSHALAVIHVGATVLLDGGMDVDPDLGDLFSIDLSDGSSVQVASKVTALPNEHYCPATLCAGPGSDNCGVGCQCVTNVADGGNNTGQPTYYCSCEEPPECSYLNQSLEPMISVSADGTSVAYESPVPDEPYYQVSIGTISDGGVKNTVIGEGQFPGLSPDGHLVAYFDPFLDGGSSTIEIRDSMANSIVAAPAAGVAPPHFSPDSAFVAFPANFKVQGAQLDGEIADVWLLQSTPTGTPVSYAEKAAWKSLTFWPASGSTEQISVLADLSDPSGEATLTNGAGSLQVDNPNSLFGTGAVPSAPVAANLHPEDFGLFPVSGGYAVSQNGSLAHWAPASSSVVRRPGTLVELGASVAEGTLQTSATVSGLAEDDVAFLGSLLSPLGGQAPGPLWGGSPNKVVMIPQGTKNNVVRFALTPDGRVFAIVQDSASTAEVWLLPL